MSPILGIYASQISGHLFTLSGSYDALASVTVPSGGLSSITFAGIPTGYSHLQIRTLFQCGTQGEQLTLQFNGDSSTSDYTLHQLVGNGSSATAAGYGTGTFFGARTAANSQYSNANYFGAAVVDILDYANVNKYKTVRSLGGADTNGNGANGMVLFRSALWLSQNAITSINCVASDSSTLIAGSTFALYGVK